MKTHLICSSRAIRFGIICLLLSAVAGLIACKDEEELSKTTAAFISNEQATYLVEDTISFANTSLNATSYLWTFGDGDSSIEKEPRHTYDSIGVYTVTLIASGKQSTDTTTQVLTIRNVIQLKSDTTHLVNDSIMAIVTRLFQTNNLSLANKQVDLLDTTYRIDRITIASYYVRFRFHTHGLTILNDYSIFRFNSDGSFRQNADTINLLTVFDPVPLVSCDSAIAVFRNTLKNDRYHSYLSGNKSIYTAELCFYYFYDTTKTCVVAWKCFLRGKTYPVTYINAKTNELLYYDSGMRT